MDNWPGIIQQWLFPPTCLLCGDAGWQGRDLCLACDRALPLNTPACPRCGRLLTYESETACGQCQQDPPEFDSTFALFRYQEPVRHLIHNLKYHARYACARLLGEMLAEALCSLDEGPELIIPVPLHPSRYRERGYNQALEIARPIARRLQIPLDYSSCIRSLATQPQTQLSNEERLRNVKKAFAVARPIRAKHVAILDDVVTTGATVNELAKVLRKAGVRRIDIWACART